MNIPKYFIPIITVGILLAGFFLRFAFTQPTTSVVFSESGDAKLVCTVDGLKCKGTADFFTSMFKEVDGIASIETVASEHKAIFTYNPSKIEKERIKELIEQYYQFDDGSIKQPFKCLEMN